MAYLKSSNPRLNEAFEWAKNMAMSYVTTGKRGPINDGRSGEGDYIPSYWAGYRTRAAFYIRDYEFLRPKDMDAPLIDVKLAPLVSRFDVKNLILLLSALMCEKRIIFIGDDLTTLSECIHAAVAILYRTFLRLYS